MYSMKDVEFNRHRTTYKFIRPIGIDGLILHLADGSNAGGGGNGKGKSGLMSAFSGGIAGGIQILITYPAEYIKTQLQLDEKGGQKLYNGSIDCIRKTYQNKGIFQCYRGMPVLLYSGIPKTGMRFYILENFRISFGDGTGQLSTHMKLLTGLVAGSFEAVLVVTPFESLKVKFINDVRRSKPQFQGLLHGIKMVLKTKGIPGIYQGSTATILKQSSNLAVRFSIAETLKDIYTNGDRRQGIPTYIIGIIGTIAGAISTFVSNPIDVIKTRMQGLESERYKNFCDCAGQLFKNEGWSVFYKGAVPHILRSGSDVAITFMVYETCMTFCNNFF